MSDRESSPRHSSQQFSSDDYLSAPENHPPKAARQLEYESPPQTSQEESHSSDDEPIADKMKRQREILKTLARKPFASKRGVGSRNPSGPKKAGGSKKCKEREVATVPSTVPATVPATVPEEEAVHPTGEEEVANTGDFQAKEAVSPKTIGENPVEEGVSPKPTDDRQLVVIHTGDTEGPSVQHVLIEVPFEEEHQEDGHETSIIEDGEEDKESSPKRQRHSGASSEKKENRAGSLIKNPEPKSSKPKKKKMKDRASKEVVLKEVPSTKDAPKKGEKKRKKKKVVAESKPHPSRVNFLFA